MYTAFLLAALHCRAKLQKQESVDGQLHANIILSDVTYTLHNTATSLTGLPILISCMFAACTVCDCRVKLQTQEIGDGQIHENAIVSAATYALENTATTLTYMLTPPLLKPLLWPIVQRFPSERLQGLNIARMQLLTAALTLTQNAMKRLGLPFDDEIQMAKNFGKGVCSATLGMRGLHMFMACTILCTCIVQINQHIWQEWGNV